MSNSQRKLAILLRVLGSLDLLALAAVVMPQAWLAAAHRFAGLGMMPTEPIVGYLTRSASALYALHGAMVLFISFDVARYERLIRFMAYAAVIHGAVILGIINNMLNMMGVSPYVQNIIKGLIILFAIYISRERRKRRPPGLRNDHHQPPARGLSVASVEGNISGRYRLWRTPCASADPKSF